jgi:serine kinase of HPr protein (carbohydrate metabolism regulator)
MTTIHATAVLVGARAVLIRGPAGSGKSSLASTLIEAAASGGISFARLIADDRVLVEAINGRLLVRPPAVLAGLMEIRGVGIRRLPYEPVGVLAWVVDLDAEPVERLPQEPPSATLEGITLPRIAVPRGTAPLPMLLAVTGASGVER